MLISNITENGKLVLEDRYLQKDLNGNVIETPDEMFHRVAKAVAIADRIYNENADIESIQNDFFDLMTSLRFLPNSPTLMNAGKPNGQLSACFVFPIEDSIEGIFETVKNAALIQQQGGGTGFSFSRIRSKGSSIKSNGENASGPVSFMRVFNSMTETIMQGGVRRGANIGVLRVDHPDIEEFIDYKAKSANLSCFNISVGITEEFMEAVMNNEEYNVIDPHTLKSERKNARDVFDKIVEAAWKSGDPGIVFLDRINKENILEDIGIIEATNPCGEQPLLPYESCNLGSINLVNCLKLEKERYIFDNQIIKKTVSIAIHFLDNVIDINKYPLKVIEEKTLETRKIGLGVMGFADALLYMGVPYDTNEALEIAERVMTVIKKEAYKASSELAKKRGTFPLFSKSKIKDQEPIRNATITTIAPTGNLSIIADCSAGIEPNFACVYERSIAGTLKTIVNPVFEKFLKTEQMYSDELINEIKENEGSIANISKFPLDIRKLFVSAGDISPEYHVKMQAAFQKYVDNAVSKTVNFKNDASKDDIAEAYKLSYKLGCKGITVFRNNSLKSQVFNVGSKGVSFGTPRERKSIVAGFTEKVDTGCGNLYITVNYDEIGVFEVFTATGKAGGCQSQSQAAARLASTALRSGVNLDEVVDQLKGIRCPTTVRQENMNCTSCPDAIAQVLASVNEYVIENNLQKLRHVPKSISDTYLKSRRKKIYESIDENEKCPECGDLLYHAEGCVRCRSCRFDRCI